MLEKTSKIVSNYILKVTLVFIYFTIAVTAFLILNNIFQWYEISIGQIVPAGLGAIGTLLLAWVTARTLEQNKDLVQSEKARIKPSIRRVGEYDTENSNNIVLGLENVGYGKAINIKILPQIYVRGVSTTWLSPHEKLDTYLSRRHTLPTIETRASSLYKQKDNIDLFTGNGGVLEGGEIDRFSTRIDYKNLNNSEWHINDESEHPDILLFTKLMEILSEEEMPGLGFHFILVYEDVLGNTYQTSIPGQIFTVTETEELSDILSNPNWIPELDRKYHKRNQIYNIKQKIKNKIRLN